MKHLQQCILWSMLLHFPVYDVIAAEVNVAQHRNWRLVVDDRCGNSNADRIIGGKNASIGWYPWIARIGYMSPNRFGKSDGIFRCGGTLINDLYVVTAAHCVSALPNGLILGRIRLGEHNTNTNPDCEDGYCAEPVQDFEPAELIVHRQYNRPLFRNDIALIRLNRRAVLSEFVLPICLPRDDLLTKNYVGELVEVAGWGVYDIGNPKLSTILQTVKLPVVKTARCTESFGENVEIGSTQMCVGGKVGEDSCSGDSGGPMMKVEALDGPPKYFLIGVVSFGVEECGSSTIPAIYTKVPNYVTWILDNIKQ